MLFVTSESWPATATASGWPRSFPPLANRQTCMVGQYIFVLYIQNDHDRSM